MQTKKLIIVITLFMGIFSVGMVGAQTKPRAKNLNAATFNIRIETTYDTGARSWENRKSQVVQLINNHKFDVFGVQEIVNYDQENDLKKLLTAYSFVSKGRDNNEGTAGERLAIFYNKQRFAILDSGFFFLSETPDKMSKGWDAALNRICMWIKLKDKVTRKSFYFFNTHFDHVGTMARAQSAKLIVAKINEIAGRSTVFCVGDFNASPAETNILTTISTALSDSRLLSKATPTGTLGTFNGWEINAPDFGEKVRIDYIFSRKIKVLSYAVLNDKFVPETFPSDHFPVVINCTFH